MQWFVFVFVGVCVCVDFSMFCANNRTLYTRVKFYCESSEKCHQYAQVKSSWEKRLYRHSHRHRHSHTQHVYCVQNIKAEKKAVRKRRARYYMIRPPNKLSYCHYYQPVIVSLLPLNWIQSQSPGWRWHGRWSHTVSVSIYGSRWCVMKVTYDFFFFSIL